MNNNLFDVYNYKLKKFNAGVNYQYRFYNPNDEEVDLIEQNPVSDVDILLNNENTNLSNCMKIKINIINAKNDRSFLNNSSLLLNSLILRIKSFEKKNLNISIDNNIDMFNQRFNLDDKLTSIFSNMKIDEIKNISSLYEINTNQFQINEKSEALYRNYHISSAYSNDIIINKNKTGYSYDENLLGYISDKNISDELRLSEYTTQYFEINNQNLLDPSIFENNINDEDIIFDKFKPFSTDIYNQKFSGDRSFCIFVGFLIKKSIKRKDGSIFKNIASEFIYYDYNNPTDLIIKYDGLIKYGNFYSYEILPVFCLSLNKNNRDYQYLICQTSYKINYKKAIDYYQPEPPNALRAKYLYNSNQVLLEWDESTNPQKDIIGYHIYRREDLNQPYELIKVYIKREIEKYNNFDLFADNIPVELFEVSDNNYLTQSFIDKFDNINKTYIYTICSFDAHGLVSNYSNQIAIRYSIIYNKLMIDNISLANAPRTYPNLYVKRKSLLFENENLLFNFAPSFKNKEKIKVYFTPDCLYIQNKLNNNAILVNNIDSKYNLNIIRLTDLKNKNVSFKM